MGLFGTPTSVWPKDGKVGDFGPILGPAHPRFSLCWPHFGPKMAYFWPAGRNFEAKLADLLASGAPFWASTSTFSNTASLRVGGRQLWSRAPDFGPAEVSNSISGTHDRPRDDISETPHEFGPVASFELAFGLTTGPFFTNTSTNLLARLSEGGG
jgi:hypothetical protein